MGLHVAVGVVFDEEEVVGAGEGGDGFAAESEATQPRGLWTVGMV